MRKLLENPVLPLLLLAAFLLAAHFGLGGPSPESGIVMQSAEIPVPEDFAGFKGY